VYRLVLHDEMEYFGFGAAEELHHVDAVWQGVAEAYLFVHLALCGGGDAVGHGAAQQICDGDGDTGIGGELPCAGDGEGAGGGIRVYINAGGGGDGGYG